MYIIRILEEFEEFEYFKKIKTEKAKKIIEKDIKMLENVGCKTKLVCKDIDYKLLSTNRPSLSYNSIIISIIDTFAKKCLNKKDFQIESIGKLCTAELTIYQKDNFRQKKVIRYFIFKYNKKNTKYVIKNCNNILYHCYIKNLIKKVKKNTENAFYKTFGTSVFKVFFPLRTEEKEPTFFACAVVIITTFILLIIVELIFIES